MSTETLTSAVAADRTYEWTTGREAISQRLNLPALLELVGPFAQGTRALDLGCGNGVIARAFAERGADVVGVDPGDDSKKYFDLERESHPARDRLRFYQMAAGHGTVAALRDAGEGPFDVVISSQVVEHVYDAWEFASCCYDALVPGGRCAVSTPYHGYLKNVLIAVTDRWDSHHTSLVTGMHIKFRSISTLTELMTKTGFEGLRFRGIGRLPMLWKSIAVGCVRPA